MALILTSLFCRSSKRSMEDGRIAGSLSKFAEGHRARRDTQIRFGDWIPPRKYRGRLAAPKIPLRCPCLRRACYGIQCGPLSRPTIESAEQFRKTMKINQAAHIQKTEQDFARQILKPYLAMPLARMALS